MAQLMLRVRWTVEKTFKQMRFEPNTTGANLIEEVVAQHGVAVPSGTIVRLFSPPTTTRRAVWVNDSVSLQAAGIVDKDIVELKFNPRPLHICYAESARWLQDFDFSPEKALLNMEVDFSDSLVEVIPSIEPELALLNVKPGHKGQKEDYSFQLLWQEGGQTRTRFLNCNMSLDEQDVPYDSYIALHPMSTLFKRSVDSMRNPIKEGTLSKVSVKDGKMTKKKKRWCVLNDTYLYYFTSQNDSSPSGIVPVEYYTVSPGPQVDKFQFELAPTGASFSKVSTVYIMAADDEREMRLWIDAIRKQSATGAGKKVFGVALRKVLSRKGQRTDCPDIVIKTIEYLSQHLELEGMFRISAGAQMIQKYKEEFDMAMDVDINRTPDPHIISGLLKLYFRELPEPLLTFELYDDFVILGDLPVAGRRAALKQLLSQLPPAHIEVLKLLVFFLANVAAHASVNLMGVENLATVFGPNLLRPRQDSAESLIHHTASISKVMHQIIQEADDLLPAGGSSDVVKQRRKESSPVAMLPERPAHFAAAAAAAAAAGAARPRPTVPTRQNRPAVPTRTGRPDTPTRQASAKALETTRVAIGVAVALYNYKASNEKELGFQKGDQMTVYQKLESGWLLGENASKIAGMIPATYVRLQSVEDDSAAFCKAQRPSPSSAGSAGTTNRAPVGGGFGSRASAGVGKLAEFDDVAIESLTAQLSVETTARATLEREVQSLMGRIESLEGRLSSAGY